MEVLSRHLNGDILHLLRRYLNELELDILKSIAMVKRRGMDLRYVYAPLEEVQLLAVRKAGHAIKYIPDPSPAVQLAAVQKARASVKWIKSPTAETLRAVGALKGPTLTIPGAFRPRRRGCCAGLLALFLPCWG